MDELGIFMLGVLCLAILFVAFEIWALVKWKGAWRLGALVPAAAFCFGAGRIIVDTSVNPASHNMWPFEIIWWSGLGLLGLGGLAVFRLITSQRQVVL